MYPPSRMVLMKVDPRIRLDLLANAADVNVDAALDRPGGSAMGQFQQLLARQHFPGMLAHGEQKSNSALVVVTLTPSGLRRPSRRK